MALPFRVVRWTELLDCCLAVAGWRQWRDEGLTQHRNWWPDLYEEVCEKQGIEPDPAVLSFATSYETQWADLKVLSGSA